MSLGCWAACFRLVIGVFWWVRFSVVLGFGWVVGIVL